MISIELAFFGLGIVFGICIGIGMYRRIFGHDLKEFTEYDERDLNDK